MPVADVADERAHQQRRACRPGPDFDDWLLRTVLDFTSPLFCMLENLYRCALRHPVTSGR